MEDYIIMNASFVSKTVMVDGVQDIEMVIVDVLLCIAIITAHAFGSYGLLSLIRNDDAIVQHFLIFNASVTEIIGTIVYILYVVLNYALTIPAVLNSLVEIVVYVLFTFMYSMNFIFITIDRLVYIILGIKYNVYCTKKTKKLIAFAWLSGLLVTVGVSLLAFLATSESLLITI